MKSCEQMTFKLTAASRIWRMTCLLNLYRLRYCLHFALPLIIKTITKFSNVIGYQQPDLSINWAPSVRLMLVIVHYASFCARSVLWSTLLSKLLGFSALITTFKNRSALNQWFVRFSNFVLVLID